VKPDDRRDLETAPPWHAEYRERAWFVVDSQGRIVAPYLSALDAFAIAGIHPVPATKGGDVMLYIFRVEFESLLRSGKKRLDWMEDSRTVVAPDGDRAVAKARADVMGARPFKDDDGIAWRPGGFRLLGLRRGEPVDL
jgi:hypothetical protein